jgi:hypothetical protein
MTEDQLEQEALGWLASVGYTPLNARDYDHLDPRLIRASNREVVLAMSHAFSLCCTLSEAKAVRDEQLGLHDDEVKFYDALANNESAVRELQDETLKKIAQELTVSLRENLSVDWSERESVQAKLRLMVKRILKKYKYPPDQQDEAVQLILKQAHMLGETWSD